MIRILLCVVTCSLVVELTTAEEEWVDDRRIRDRFVEQTLALKNSPDRAGISAATLREQLNSEHRGLPALELATQELWKGPRGELYRKAKSSTLIIGHLYRSKSGDEWLTNLAGGVVITEDGVAVTNHHVLNFEKAAIFAAMDEQGTLFAIEKILASSGKDDVAIVQLEQRVKFNPAPLADSAEVGESIVVVSHPDAHFFSFTSGNISRFSRDPDNGAQRLEVTAPFARGSSGSGIFNRHGHLVGIASATNAIYYEEDGSEPRNLQMVIHSGVPIQSVKQLIKGE